MKTFGTSFCDNLFSMTKTVFHCGRLMLAAGMLCTASNLQGADVHIGKTSMRVGTSGSIVLENNMAVGANALIWNEGAVYLTNQHEVTLSLNTILDGAGTYFFNGSADYTVAGEGAAVSSLDVESGNTVYVMNDFSVSGVLTLGAGVIKVSEGASLKVQDTSPEAIVFNDRYDNSSFIEGTLERNTQANGEYVFPLGSVSNGFHPFKAGKISSSGYLNVSYREDYADIWNSGKHNNVTIEDCGSWEVGTASSGITFQPYLSLYTPAGLMDGSYNLFYTSEPDAASPGFSLDYNSKKSSDGHYVMSESAYTSGLFAVNKITTINNEGEEEVPEMVNILVKNGTGRSTFDVQGIENYKEVILSIYNRFGNKIYESSNYANDFDVKDYRPGTYFYELTLVTKEDRKMLCRNIIEIVEYK